MIAAWYDRQGPPAEVLQVGELPAAEPGPGEVRVRLTVSGANPGDIKKRQGWLGSSMAFGRIVPHSDGAEAKDAAARDLTAAAAQAALSVPVAEVVPLARIAAAHELIESGKAPGRVLVAIPS